MSMWFWGCDFSTGQLWLTPANRKKSHPGYHTPTPALLSPHQLYNHKDNIGVIMCAAKHLCRNIFLFPAWYYCMNCGDAMHSSGLCCCYLWWERDTCIITGTVNKVIDRGEELTKSKSSFIRLICASPCFSGASDPPYVASLLLGTFGQTYSQNTWKLYQKFSQ